MVAMQLPVHVSATLELVWILPGGMLTEYLAFRAQRFEAQAALVSCTATSTPETCAALDRAARASYVPPAFFFMATSVGIYLLAHLLLNGHMVLARRQAIMDARSAGINQSQNTELASRPHHSPYRAVRAAQELHIWLTERTSNSRVLRYWFEPLPQSESQIAREAQYYGHMMSVLALGAMLIPVVCGSVVVATFAM
jgi:hypothetical protein